MSGWTVFIIASFVISGLVMLQGIRSQLRKIRKQDEARARAKAAERAKAEKIAKLEAVYRARGFGHGSELLAMIEYDRQETL